jgi:hypothetical protein
MPCDERKRDLAFKYMPELLTITKIPAVAHLVIGATPGEFRKGRTFYDDPAYYLTDVRKIDGEDTSRFFKCDFTYLSNYNRVGIVFCECFDTVICDYSVFHHFGSYSSVPSLFSMVKPGGSLIIAHAMGILPLNKSKTRNEIIEENVEFQKNRIAESLVGHKVNVYKCSDFILANEVANTIYGPLIHSKIMEENSKCFVIVKPRVGGKRKRGVTRRKNRSMTE